LGTFRKFAEGGRHLAIFPDLAEAPKGKGRHPWDPPIPSPVPYPVPYPGANPGAIRRAPGLHIPLDLTATPSPSSQTKARQFEVHKPWIGKPIRSQLPPDSAPDRYREPYPSGVHTQAIFHAIAHLTYRR
jgi:hypothetical protein